MARFCSNCGKELNEKADICLNCGVLVNKETNKNTSSNVKNNKKKGLPTWAIVLIIIGCVIIIPLIIFIILGLFVFNAIKSNVGDVREYLNDYMEDYEVLSEGTIGDVLGIDGVKFTLNNALKYSSIENSTYSSTPKDGNEYLVFFFEVENTEDTDKLVTYLNFKGYVDNEEKLPIFVVGEIDGVNNLNKALTAYEKVNGYVIFEVNKGWDDFDLYYGGLLGKEKIVYYVTNEENNNGEL